MTVELSEVSKTFGSGRSRKAAVESASWKAVPGEIFGLLGPNGAGKTTMIRMILDLIRPDSGEVLIDGRPRLNSLPEFRRRLGYLPEERGLYKNLGAREMLVYMARLKGLDPGEARSRADALLDELGLAGAAGHKVHALSKGMTQALQIACCIIHDPDILILDEPFYGLDPVNTLLVRNTIRSLKAGGRLVILCTHMMSEAEALCDRISIISGGRILVSGSLREIQWRHAPFDLIIDEEADPAGLGCVDTTLEIGRGKGVMLKEGSTMRDFMAEMAALGRRVRRLEEASMPLEDIYVSVVKGMNGAEQ